MGNKNRTILTLNGQHYDAVTGEVVDDETAAGARVVRPIDDVVAAKNPLKAKHPTVSHPKPHTVTPTYAPKSMDVMRAPHHVRHHQPQRTSTLMRATVSKPEPGLKRHVKAITRTDILAKSPTLAVAPKWSVQQIDPKRLARSEHIAKSQLIRKFSPAIEGFVSPSAATVYTANTVPTSLPAADVPERSQDVFERALATSTAHHELPVNPKKLAKKAKKQAKHAARVTKRAHKPVHHRAASVVAASIAVLLLTGFVAYQNKTNLTLRYASAQAGFHALLPSYKPVGYTAGKFSYSAGFVALNFHNSNSGKNFSLSQQTTKWDSQALLDNYVAVNNHSYQTLQNSNRIVYIYGHNNASWVDHGVWYQLNTNGSLSTSDILSVASSM